MLATCVRCKKNETHRRIDERAVCDSCFLADAQGGKVVKNYSRFKPVRRKDIQSPVVSKSRTYRDLAKENRRLANELSQLRPPVKKKLKKGKS